MKWTLAGALAMAATVIGLACARASVDYANFPNPREDLQTDPTAGEQTMFVAGGCFWCTEGAIQQIPGVISVVSGYAGDTKETANYNAVSGGDTKHAEAIKITFDPSRVTFGKLLKVFFSIAHDPTTLNRQGADVGTQYRSAIFYQNEDEKRVSRVYIEQLDSAKVFPSPIVTTLEPLVEFFEAEAYHQDYADKNPNQGYIIGAALPKIEKAKKVAATMTTQPAN